MAEFVGAACFCLFAIFNLVIWFSGVMALLRRLVDRNRTPVPLEATSLRDHLSAIRGGPEPLAALDEFIASLPHREQAPPPAATPEPPPVAPATDSPADSPADSALPNWLQLDSITLLLYLGAALVVIAAGVFVASAWEVIPGFFRWLIVVILALGFLGTGELFVRWRPVLQRAGETFRTVGLLLLPFVILALDRFVLNGAGTPQFWLLAGVGLALFYYAFYRFSSADWSASALATLSLGIVTFNLVPTLGLAAEWHLVAQLGLAWVLLLVARGAWRARPADARTLRELPLVATHVASGSIVWLVSALATASYLTVQLTQAAPPAHLPLMIYSALTAGLFLWLAGIGRNGLPLLGTALSLAALATLSPFGWQSGEAFQLPFNVVAWGALALGALLVAPLAERWRSQSQPALVAASLLLGIAMWNLAASLSLGWIVISSTLLALLLLGVTLYYRHALWLLAAIVMGHVAILTFFGWLDLPIRSPLPLSLVWTGAAALWLLLLSRRGLPEWLRNALDAAFVLEALWAATYAVPEHETVVVVAPLLLLLWLLWGHVTRRAWGLLAATMMLFYALWSLGALRAMPPLLPALFLLGGGVLLSTLVPRLPTYLRRTARDLGPGISAFAPLGAYLVRDPLEMAVIPLAWIGPVVLLLGGALHLALGLLRRERAVLAASGALLYGGLAWSMIELDVTGPQWYSAPLALLLLSYGWLFRKYRDLFEIFAVGTLLLPALAEATSPRFLFTALLGGWGLVLIGLGITRRRRVLTVGGSAALILAALRQLWALISVLPPGFAIGVVGLLLMIAAVLLTLRRDRIIAALRGGDQSD